jgi:hypothetical protein
MLRLQLGIPAVLVPIAMNLGTDLSRAQYLALHRAALTTPAAIKSAEPDALLAIAGGDEELSQRIRNAAVQLADLERAA